MNIKDLVYDLVVEAVKNKGLFDRLMTKWKETYPNLTDGEGEYIYNRHDQLKGQMKLTNPAVVSFLTRYDGNYGTKKYELKDITDITRFDTKHLIEFLKEFGRFELNLVGDENNDSEKKEEEIKKIFDQNGGQKTPEKIEFSKSMWFDSSTALINEGDFRVYEIMNQAQSIRMGYYYQTIHKKNWLENNGRGVNSPWCVTWRGGDVKEYREDENGNPIGAPIFSHGGNMYSTYRTNYNRTFYFVIDESKSDTDKYHMSALQIDNYGRYILSSMYNDGDNSMSWDDIVRIYPKIAQFKDKIKSREMSENEVQSKSIVDIINENPGSQYEFARQTPERKEAYIDALGTLKTPKSWTTMSNDLRSKYVDVMQINDAYQRFSNLEFLTLVLKTEGFTNKLDRKLKILGRQEGIAYLVDYLMKHEYQVGRRSIDNSKISTYRSRVTKKFGLFDYSKGTWIKSGGIEYGPYYNKVKDTLYFDENRKGYIVELYSDSMEENEKSFYAVFPVGKDSVSAHFMSKGGFDLLKEKFQQEEGKKFGKLSDFSPETDIDLK